MCVHVWWGCTCTHVCVWVCAHAGKSQKSRACNLFWDKVIHWTWSELRVPETLLALSVSPPFWGYRYTPLHPAFYVVVGIELRSSRLCVKHFTKPLPQTPSSLPYNFLKKFLMKIRGNCKTQLWIINVKFIIAQTPAIWQLLQHSLYWTFYNGPVRFMGGVSLELCTLPNKLPVLSLNNV